VVKIDNTIDVMDEEWMALILEAKELGITKETIRDFLNQNGVQEFLVGNR
jgi:DNA-binding transcriptional MerR regulator